MDKDAVVIKKLAELGLLAQPAELPEDVEEVLKRLNNYQKEVNQKLDPKTLNKYLG